MKKTKIELIAMNNDNKPLVSPDFFICTSPEMDALERAAADGKHSLNYANTVQEIARVHQIAGASHFVRLAGIGAETQGELEVLTAAQDADATIALLYIAHLLAPPSPLAPREYAGGWIDFDDVIDKIGWTPRNSAHRRELRARLHQFIVFGERAEVMGKRRGTYIERATGQEIETVIRGAIWRIVKTEEPAQKSLYPDTEAPVRVELVMSSDWAQLLAQPQTAQYLPMGELLGTIPGNKPSGAWARVIGLALASFWRRQPQAALDCSIKPTRRELLERYTPKTGPVSEVLTEQNLYRAIEYWCAALQILVKSEFLAPEGEPQILPSQMRDELPRQGWAQIWLNAPVTLKPGGAFGHTIVQRTAALPQKPAKKRGRPRKIK